MTGTVRTNPLHVVTDEPESHLHDLAESPVDGLIELLERRFGAVR